MTGLTRRTPSGPAGLWNLHSELNRLFDGFSSQYFDEEALARGTWVPAVDVAEEGDHIVVRAELPGMNQEDIDIQLENGVLTLRGEKRFEKKSDESNYYRIERAYGTFVRSFTLPRTVDQEGISARYNDGVLEITIPKREEAKPRQIRIEQTS